MKIRIFVGFVLGAALTTVVFLAGNVGAIVQDPEPILTSIAPNIGYTTGGEAVTITGQYFDGVTQVLFDTDVAQIQTVSTDSIVVIAPPHAAGFVNVLITNTATTFTAVNAYEYIVPPPSTVISLSPASGSIDGGTTVSIAGTFLNNTESVTFDGSNAIITSVSDSQVVVFTPAHEAGLVDVVVNTPSGTTTIVSAFEYVDDNPPPAPMPPSVSSLSPNEGSITGGTEVTIYGTNLDTVETVLFGNETASIISSSNTELVVTSPAHTAGLVSVTVKNPDGSIVFENSFTFSEVVSPPAYTYCDWHDNGQNWKEVKNSGNIKHKKALVCHQQSKPKNTFKTLCLPIEAIPAYINHGDELGACSEDGADQNNREDKENKNMKEESGWKFWK